MVRRPLIPSWAEGLPLDADPAGEHRLHRAVGRVHRAVADQRACASSPVEGNRRRSIRTDHLQIEIDHPLARDIPVAGTQAVRSVARGATEAGIDVRCVLAPTPGAVHDRQIMTLTAHRIWTIHA